MFRPLGLALAALALFLIAGGQWATLQTVAWAGMLRTYAQQSGSLAAAVEQTFDGQHPCALCARIAAAKSQERRELPADSAARGDAKIKAVAAKATPRLRANDAWLCAASRATDAPFPVGRADEPPTPPPRPVFFAA